jgi:predicted PurR-regulated permease PerM
VNRAVEASIHIGLVILLAATCFFILRPFIPLIAWGIIVAIAVYPRYRQLQLVLGGRGVLAAVLITLLLLALLIVPLALLSGTLIGGIQALAAHIKDGTPIIPPPPAGVESWPFVGVPL